MHSDTSVLAHACTVISERPLKARELRRQLAARGIAVEVADLQRVLSNAKGRVSGLGVTVEREWTFNIDIGKSAAGASAAGETQDASKPAALPRSRLDRFVHRLVSHYRGLAEKNEPSEPELAELRALAGDFGAREVEDLRACIEGFRTHGRSPHARTEPELHEAFAVGSEPHLAPAVVNEAVPVQQARPRSRSKPRQQAEPVIDDANATAPTDPRRTRSKETLTIKAERREDGLRVERWYRADGTYEMEIVATIGVTQLGDDETGAVYLMLREMMAAQEHFDFAKERVKSAGGKFWKPTRRWRFHAPVGLRVVQELAAEGYAIEREAPGLDQDTYSALVTKFLGPEQYRQPRSPVVTLTPAGFVLEACSDERYPCTLGEALMLDEAGWTFSDDAYARVAEIRAAAGFLNAGCARQRSVVDADAAKGAAFDMTDFE